MLTSKVTSTCAWPALAVRIPEKVNSPSSSLSFTARLSPWKMRMASASWLS